MFVMGFICGVVFLLGLTGFLAVISKPWRLTRICDSVLSPILAGHKESPPPCASLFVDAPETRDATGWDSAPRHPWSWRAVILPRDPH
jgi:hypothetical protein